MKCKIKEIFSNGLIIGSAYNYFCQILDTQGGTIEEEKLKFHKALMTSVIDIQNLKRKNPELEEYLVVQELICCDPELNRQVDALITKGVKASTALDDVMAKYTSPLGDSTSTYLANRVADLVDIKNRIINNMNNEKTKEENQHYILITDVLYPSYLINHRNSIVGVIARTGGYTSHAAILCRNWDIPFVVCEAKFNDLERLIIDTRKGFVIKNPTPLEIKSYTEEIIFKDRFLKKAVPHKDFMFLANVSSNLDLKRVKEYEFDGIGLYRTELIFMNKDRPYTYEEQYAIYSEAVCEMKDKPICFRTFDVNNDKKISYLKCFRKAIDNYINNPKTFEDQIKAILKANQGVISIMFPMIETKKEFDYLRNWVIRIIAENNFSTNVRIGMMLETKTAVEHIEDFSDADFISIGTNDLTAELYNENRDDITLTTETHLDDLLGKLIPVIEMCKKNNICLSVCGELAAIPFASTKLYEIGIRNLSVSPSAIQMLNLAYNNFEKK